MRYGDARDLSEKTVTEITDMVQVAELRTDDDEFVAAQAGHGVAGARSLLQTVREILQYDITNGVSQGVVDGLETVKIQ